MGRRRPAPLVSFDVGGTLIRPGRDVSLVSRLVRLSPQPAVHVRALARTLLLSGEVSSRSQLRELCSRLDIRDYSSVVKYDPGVPDVVAGAQQALELVAEHATVVTISNVNVFDYRSAGIPAELMRPVTRHFPSCVTGRIKPDPDAFSSVAAEFGLPSDLLIHVGDEFESDVRGAVNVGARAVWVTGPDREDDSFSPRVHVVSGIVDAADVVVDVIKNCLD